MTKSILHKFLGLLLCSGLFFGTVRAASVSGMAWYDTNGDGIRTAGETPYADIYVILETPTGTQVSWTQTNAAGQYQFSNIAAGSYRVKFANPGGNVFMSPLNMGLNEAIDNDANPYGITAAMTLAAATSRTNIDAGFNNLGACFTPVLVTLNSSTCDYMGTLATNDDVVVMTITATGGTGAWGWDYPTGGISMAPYGVPRTINVPVVNGTATLTINDHDNTFCNATVAAPCPPPTGTLILTCPPALDVFTDPCCNTALLNVVPTRIESTCPIGAVSVTQTSGPTTGKFSVGTTSVCYRAEDECGNVKTCCTTVKVSEPCDTKKNGGIIWDVLDTEVDSIGQPVYHMRVTNNNAQPLMWVAFALPDGVTAASPANNSMYMTASGRAYEVRNPNFSPFYSIRFKSKTGGIANGESDVFTYTLPQQVNPWYINTKVRLSPKVFIEAYLDTWDCMPMPNAGNSDPSVKGTPNERNGDLAEDASIISVYPNPAADQVFINLEDSVDGVMQFQLFDMTGRLVKEQVLTGGVITSIQLPNTQGLHLVRLTDSQGEAWTHRLLIKGR